MWREERTSDEFVSGVTHDGRQKWVARCRVGDLVEFVREPTNRFDENAIQVIVRGRQVGYLGADRAEKFANGMDRGVVRFEGVVSAIERFDLDDKEYLGLRLEVRRFRWCDPNADDIPLPPELAAEVEAVEEVERRQFLDELQSAPATQEQITSFVARLADGAGEVAGHVHQVSKDGLDRLIQFLRFCQQTVRRIDAAITAWAGSHAIRWLIWAAIVAALVCWIVAIWF